MRIVLKIGGSLLYKPNNEIDVKLIQEYSQIITELVDNGHKIAVVMGGGKLARTVIKASKELGIAYTFQDIIGVEISRIHALLMIGTLGEIAYRIVPRSFDQLREALSSEKVICIGGLQPAQSTNAVASLIAEIWQADLLINLSDIAKVCDKDPKIYSDAKEYDEISIDQLIKLIDNNRESPGSYDLFDKVGAEIIKRSSIKLIFADGRKPRNVLEIIKGKNVGTVVTHDS
ncbi:MAG: UMP kinase [Candidatus Heimdallarchaeaceae archaeon]